MRSDTALRRWKLVTEARMLSTESGQIVEAGNDLAEALAAANARIEAGRRAVRDEAAHTSSGAINITLGARSRIIAALTGEADDE